MGGKLILSLAEGLSQNERLASSLVAAGNGRSTFSQMGAYGISALASVFSVKGQKVGRYLGAEQTCRSVKENKRQCLGETQRRGGQCQVEVQGHRLIEALASLS